jgi:hypothetical protein
MGTLYDNADLLVDIVFLSPVIAFLIAHRLLYSRD